FFFSSRRRHTRSKRDWSSDVCSSDLLHPHLLRQLHRGRQSKVGHANVLHHLALASGRIAATALKGAPKRPSGVVHLALVGLEVRSEERRVGKEGRSRRWEDREKEKRR